MSIAEDGRLQGPLVASLRRFQASRQMVKSPLFSPGGTMHARRLGRIQAILAVASAATAVLKPACVRAEGATDPTTAWALAALDGGQSAAPGKDGRVKTGITAQGQLGLVLAHGNTDTRTANAKFEVVRATRAVKDDVEIDGLYGKTGNVVTAERWETNLQRDWNLSARLFWFADGHFEHDLFSGFAYQGSAATGAGYKFIDTDSDKLQGQIGAGYRRLRPEQLITDPATGQVTGRIEGTSEGELVGNGKLSFEHSFNKQTKITDAVMTVAGSQNVYVENDFALTVKLNGSFSLSVGYTVRNNSNPPPGLLHTDTLTTVNLVYQAGQLK
jgi:putative salt-induced outer membrane protein